MLEEKPIPDEINEENQPVLQYIQRISDTALEDQQSLARIRQRLLKVSAGPLPVPLDDSASHEKPLKLFPEASNAQREGKKRIIQPSSAQKIWLQRLNLLAAVLLVAFLAGALAAVLTVRGIIPTGHGPEQVGPFTLRPGWEQVAMFNGTGSKTMDGLDTRLPRLRGSALVCSGIGNLEIEVTGKDTQGGGYQWFDGYQSDKQDAPCTSSSTLAPATLTFDLYAKTIQTVKVTAPAGVNWQWLIVGATQQPEFEIGSEWQFKQGMSGNSSMSTGFSAPITKDGKEFWPKTWGYIITCLGEGYGKVLTRDDHGLVSQTFTECDGQPRFYTQEYPVSGIKIQRIEVEIHPKGDFLWSITILSCLDEKGCKTGPTG